MGIAYHVNVKENNMLSSCVTPAYINALETMALTEKQQEKVQRMWFNNTRNQKIERRSH